MPAGRPTLYRADKHPELAFAYLLAGRTEAQVCEYFGVSVQTFETWKKEHPEFLEAIEKAKNEPDDRIEASLYNRAMGLKVVEKHESEDGVKVITKELPPDTAAAFIWLKNRKRYKWKDKWADEEVKSTTIDPDLIRFKIHSRAFDLQQRVLMSKAKDIGLMCGRRAGKSETNKFLAVATAQAKEAQKVLIIGLTIGKTQQIYEQDILNLAQSLGLAAKKNSVHGWIEFDNKSLIQFGGTSSKVEKEKYRGQFWDLIIIDEAQSQPGLGAFLQEVINPMLVDRNGCLVMSGSGPRTRGTYWERFYLNPSPSGLRLNWNLSHNPYIHDYQHALDTVREKYGYAETDPLYQREYLGLPVYDDDALVLRMAQDNYWQPADIEAWIAGQSPADIRFVGGLDYGVRDSDAFVVVMYSEKRNEKFLVYEHKANGQDITQLKEAIDAGIKYINESPLFAPVYNKAFDIYADTSDTKISMEFRSRYGLPILPAIKHDKALAIQMLQDEVRRRFLKIPKGGPLDDESLKTVFKRIEIDGQPSVLTREIDDDLYHPDIMDAVLYAFRGYWLTHLPDHAGESFVPMVHSTPEQDAYWQGQSERRDGGLF